MSLMPPFRDTVISIKRNGIGAVSALGLGAPDVIPLWFGESDLATPKFIREAAKKALDDGQTFYTFSRGIPQLREEIQRWVLRHQSVVLGPERVSVPGSAMMAINIALQLTVNSGDNVVIVAPIWPNIFNAVRTMGAEPRLVRLGSPQDGGKWTLDLNHLFATCDARTRAIFVCSPGNPTGWMITKSEQDEILRFTRDRGIAIISDEVYAPLVYDRPHATFASIATDDDPVFIINSFSKAWAMTGWRVGWLTHPTKLAQWVAELTNIDNTGAATFAQFGAATALADGDNFITDLITRCRNGRDEVDAFVRENQRITWARPEGAFYGFLEIDGMRDSLAFASELVTKHRVGVAPGIAFGLENDAENDRFIRICFAQDRTRIAEAMTRIAAALK